jgi:hypothetical protein
MLIADKPAPPPKEKEELDEDGKPINRKLIPVISE